MTGELAVVVESTDGRRDLLVTVSDPNATIGDLAVAVGLGSPSSLVVDGVAAGSRRHLATVGLRRGSVVAAGDRLATRHPVQGSNDSSPTWIEPWIRGPRRSYPRRYDPPEAPEEPSAPEPVTRPSLAMLMVPIGVATLTAVLWNPMFAVFALISPVVTVATWIDAERRARAELRRLGRLRLRNRLIHRLRLHRHRRRVAATLTEESPHATELVAWPSDREPRLWQRRPGHDDYLSIRIGTAAMRIPVMARLDRGAVLGVAGSRPSALGHVRALVAQLTAHHGPADLTLGVVGHLETWDWLKWLPHVTTREGALAAAEVMADSVVRCNVLIVDTTVEASAFDAFVDRGGIAIVVSERTGRLPGATSLVIDCEASTMWLPADERVISLAPDFLAADAALGFALDMAQFIDPERTGGGASLSRNVRLVDLLEGSDPEGVAARWKQSAVGDRWSAPLGETTDGVFELDLRRDGPHGLIAGTTGSGKSELLRALVTSLAASIEPSRLGFVLIDYKGGSAFDACADLPHTVGLVTDLDAGLAERALVCLEAELRRREEILRAAGDSSIDDAGRRGGASLGRLLVVIDEFAAMVEELPDFVERLVGIAQRGRSLGVHLLLATQRPSGVVSEAIRANLDLRIALRVQSTGDARDVVGTDEPATISKRVPGRASVRLGAEDPVLVQTAHTGAVADGRLLGVRPFSLIASDQDEATGTDRPTDLVRLVAAIRAAAEAGGHRPVRSPWQEPLPDRLLLDALPGSPDGVVFGLVDDLAAQRWDSLEWSLDDGHLLLVGLPGSGTTTALATIVVATARSADPPAIYVVSGDDGDLLDPLAAMTPVGAVVRSSDHARMLRLLTLLGSESTDRTMLVVDGYEHCVARLDEDDPTGEARAMLDRIFERGAAAGVVVVAAAGGPSSVPYRTLAACPERLVFRLADGFDYRALGSHAPSGERPPGRAMYRGRDVQIAIPHDDGIAAAVAATPAGGVKPSPVETLRAEVRLDGPAAAVGSVMGDTWVLPIGIDDRTRDVASLRVAPGVAALVAGPVRSGRSTALTTLARSARGAGLRVVALAPSSSPLDGAAGTVTDDVGEAIAALATGGRVLVLVDDADGVDGGVLLDAVAREPVRLRLVGAGHTNRLRSRYGHWSSGLGADGVGLLLDAQRLDGDLLGVSLPQRAARQGIPGRGWLVASHRPALVQVALT